MNALPGQMELATVIDHKPRNITTDTRRPAGIRLAKMLSKYDSAPSSDLWRDIQSLAREILK
jgi:hypothetical protein